MDTASIEQVFEEQAKSDPFSGAALVRHKGEVIYTQGHGLAYRAESIPNLPNTRFATASGTKTFTAIAVCQLIEQGKFNLDTPITECLKADLPDYDPAITVRHLLTHTSGIPDYMDEDEMTDEDFRAMFAKNPAHTLRSPADYLRMFPRKAMNFSPGARFKYCNGGYLVLALLVEQQSGMPYQQYVEKNVFALAGMTDSGFFESDNFPARTAFGYLYDEQRDRWHTNIFFLPIIGGGDGGAYVTAPDMVKFWDAVLKNELLSPAMTQQLLTPHAADGEVENRHYGYGVWIATDENKAVRRIAAIGGDQGVNFISALYPQHDTLLTIIGNTDGPTWEVLTKLQALILGQS